VASGKYPLSRPVLVVSRAEPTAAARDFIAFMVGEGNRALVAEHGFVPNGH
jgi:ABC-type phosphate transport system substrate-binding protein